MALDNEKFFEVTVPSSHRLAERINGGKEAHAGVYRTRLADELKTSLGNGIFTLRETSGPVGPNEFALTCRFVVRGEEAVQGFRQKLDELGLTAKQLD